MMEIFSNWLETFIDQILGILNLRRPIFFLLVAGVPGEGLSIIGHA